MRGREPRTLEDARAWYTMPSKECALVEGDGYHEFVILDQASTLSSFFQP